MSTSKNLPRKLFTIFVRDLQVCLFLFLKNLFVSCPCLLTFSLPKCLEAHKAQFRKPGRKEFSKIAIESPEINAK